MEMLRQKGLHEWACETARREGQPRAKIAEIHQSYGDQCYRKRAYDQAVQAYMKTIDLEMPIEPLIDARSSVSELVESLTAALTIPTPEPKDAMEDASAMVLEVEASELSSRTPAFSVTLKLPVLTAPAASEETSPID